MSIFALCCALTGAGVGALQGSVLGVCLTSLQIVVYLAGFWAAGELTGGQFALWLPAGLCAHQACYLTALVLRNGLQPGRHQETSVAAKVDHGLDLMQSIANRIEARAPEIKPDAANLSRELDELRGVLMSTRKLERLLAERKAAA